MKIKQVILLLLVSFTFLNNKCHNGEDDIEPVFLAEIQQDKHVIESGDVVTFNSVSSAVGTARWDFGNGVTSTTSDTTIVYTSPGTYAITLTATHFKTGEELTKTSTVKVGERYITGIKINNLLIEKSPTEFWWDNQDGPDLQLQLKRSDQPNWEFTRDLKDNVVSTDLPLTQQFQPVKVTNANWVITLEDYDSPTHSDVISSWNFNPAKAPAFLPQNGITAYQISYKDGTGAYTLTNTPALVELLFEIR